MITYAIVLGIFMKIKNNMEKHYNGTVKHFKTISKKKNI